MREAGAICDVGGGPIRRGRPLGTPGRDAPSDGTDWPAGTRVGSRPALPGPGRDLLSQGDPQTTEGSLLDTNGAAEANRLYWETDTSVADIAERFDLSRRAFYEVITPVPAGTACPECGQGLCFENRSGRRDRHATCPGCGAQTGLGPDPDADADAMRDPAPAPRDLRADARVVEDAGDARTPDLRGRAVMLGGAAIAGVALGTVAALLARRRD